MVYSNYDLERQALNHFKNALVLKSNDYSVTMQTKETDKNKDPKTFVVMASYFTKIHGA